MLETLFKIPPGALQDGQFAFLGPTRILVLVLIGLTAYGWFAYRSMAGRTPAWKTLFGLRVALLLCIFLALAIPAFRIAKARGETFTAVLVDTSSSMAIPDCAEGTRLDAAKQILENTIRPKLGEQNKLLVFQFDETVRRAGNTDALKADGNFTNVFRGVRDMEAELRGMPLTSVVLLTDGAKNTGGTVADAASILKARGVPLYAVGLGNLNPPNDYEIVRVVAPKRVRRNSEVEVQVAIRHTGYSEPFELILSRGDTQVVSRTVTPKPESDVESIKLNFTPDHEESATYTLSVQSGKDEQNTTNNKREFLIEIQDGRLPVLYVEGSPRLEYRFLRRALYTDKDFRVVGLLRLGDDRFYVQSANESESFLSKGFPTTLEQLYAFQAVIIGDTEASYFTPEQLAMLDQFVKTRGGGLMMLGGVNSFSLGKYAGTPVANLLPTAMTPNDGPYTDERYKVRVLQSIGLHPVMRLSLDPEANRALWAQAPPLIGLTPVQGVKTGALTLLSRDSDSKPVMAVHNYGAGRVAAFMSGGSWYWRMSLPADVEFHEKFWKQLVRWLAVGAKERLTAETDADVYARGKTVNIRATALAKDLQPVNDASILAVVTDPLGNTEEITLDWILSEDGVYQAQYTPKEEGDYRVSVTVDGWETKPVETDFRVSAPTAESADAGLKETVLREMAEAANGRYFAQNEVAELPPELTKAAANVQIQGARPEERPIWDMPVLFLAIFGLMMSEWIVRRKVGLA